MTLNNNASHNMTINDLPENPYDLFKEWFQLAAENEPNDPNAVCLATADKDGKPSNRMVLIKGVDKDQGFGFYTNAEGRKGTELSQNPYAAMCLHWKSLRRQIRIEGKVEQVDDDRADQYFASRGRDSRISAWASQQSRPLENYDVFKQAAAEQQNRFAGQEDIPRPPYWKGYRLAPTRIEFWIDGENRMHQRYVYELSADGKWSLGMLYP